jgi:hypothetical protein
MGENQRIEKLLEKMSQLLKEIDKLRQPKKSGNFNAKWKNNSPRKLVNLAQTEEGISNRAPTLNGTSSSWILE